MCAGTHPLVAVKERQFGAEKNARFAGDMQLSANKVNDQARSASIWQEIRNAFSGEKIIKGRVLNAVNSGYAVGIGGFIAFLPASQLRGQIQVGALHNFKARFSTRFAERNPLSFLQDFPRVGKELLSCCQGIPSAVPSVRSCSHACLPHPNSFHSQPNRNRMHEKYRRALNAAAQRSTEAPPFAHRCAA